MFLMPETRKAAKPRHSRPVVNPPLTESMLADVRQAVIAVRGVGARSVRVHGVTVLLDMRSEAQHATPESKTTQGQPSGGAAKTRKRDDELKSKQRRSRRRLEARVKMRAEQEQQAHLQGDDMETSEYEYSEEKLAAMRELNRPPPHVVELMKEHYAKSPRQVGRHVRGPSTKAAEQPARVATSGSRGEVRGEEVGGHGPQQTWPTPAESKMELRCPKSPASDAPRQDPLASA